MKIRITLVLALACSLSVSVAMADGADQWELKCHLYKINGNFDGDISITDAIWSGFGDTQAESDPMKWIQDLNENENVSVFTVADLPDIGGLHLVADENGWSWNGEPEPRKTSGFPSVEKLGAPTVLNVFGPSFTIGMNPSDPPEYFEILPDGNYKISTSDLAAGFEIGSDGVEKGASGRIILRDFEISITSIENREPLEGTNLDVGKPIPTVRSFKKTISIKPGMDYGFRIRFKQYGTVLAKIRLTLK